MWDGRRPGGRASHRPREPVRHGRGGQQQYFGHQTRIQISNIFGVVGENLAWHSGRQALVRWTLRAWMRSPAHRAVILHHPFRWLGAGLRRGRFKGMPATMWVLHLGG